MIQLYLDEDVHRKAAYALRTRGFDVISTIEAGRQGSSDKEQLEFAVLSARTLFTFNIRDYIILHKEYYSKEKKHFGIILSNQIDISELIRKLIYKVQLLKPESIYNQLYWL